MVVISAPAHSTPRTQQELTSRPSIRTLHAPQLPLLQPSLEPVSPSRSRKTSRRLSRGSQRKSTGSPLITALTAAFPVRTSTPIGFLSHSLDRAAQCPLRQHAHQVPPVLRCPPVVCDRP